MLPFYCLPLRSFLRSRLFATTALISLTALAMAPGMARADMDLDNDLVDLGWSNNSQIWLDEDGDHVALPDNETGILTGNSGGRINLNVIGPVAAAGLRVDGGSFRLRGVNEGLPLFRRGELFADDSGPLEFWVGQGHQLLLDLAVTGDAHIDDGRGLVVLNGGRTLDGDVVNDGFFAMRGTVDGDIISNNRLNLAGTVNGRVDDYGRTVVVGNSSAEAWVNHTTGELVVQSPHRLIVGDTLQNSGEIEVLGELRADVNNGATGSVLVAGGTLDGNVINAGAMVLDDGTLDGNVTNSGSLGGSGTVLGTVQNTGTVTTGGALSVEELVNDGQVTVSSGESLAVTDARLENNNRLTVGGTLTGGLANAATGTVTMGSAGNISGAVENDGTMNVAGRIQGALQNDNILTTSGNVRITRLDNTATGRVTVGTGHTMTVDQTVQNAGIAAIAGRLAGNMNNSGTATITGTLAGDMRNTGTTNLNGGSVTGDLENDGTLNARGTVAGTLENDATLNLTGALQVGQLDNRGTTNVDVGETLTATQRIDNTNALNVAGTVTVNGAQGIQNAAAGTVTLTGATVNANLTNQGTLLVNTSSEVNGDLTNRNQMTLDGTAGPLTLTVNGTFTNSGQLTGTNGTEDTLRVVTDLYANEGGTTTNVDIIGDVLNRSILTYTQDAFLDGDLTNDTAGDVTVSAGLDVRGHDIDNRGDVHITTDPDSGGALNNVGALSNEGSFIIDAGTSATAQSVLNDENGVMTVAGTLTSASPVENAAALNLSGTLAGGLDNSGTTTLAAGQVTGAVTNSGVLRGAGTVAGGVANSGNMAMTGTVAGTVTNAGTLNQTGTLGVGGLVNNEIVSIAAGGVLNSTTMVQNNDRMTVTGTLGGAVQNNGAGRLALNGGTVTGAVTNAGQMTGTGTVTGALSNSGNATLGGRLAAGVSNAASGVLVSQGTLSTASLVNQGRVEVASGSTLQSDGPVQNNRDLLVAGRLAAALTNSGSAVLNGGTIAGAVTNGGSLTGTGTIDGALANNGAATMGGRVTGAVTNAGTLTSAGTLRVGSLVNDELLNVAAGSTLRSDGTLVNNDRATVAGRVEGTLSNLGTTTLAGGTLAGQLQNGGTLTGTGTVDGTLANAGNATIAGRVTRLENTGTLALEGDLRVGTLINDEAVMVSTGHRLSLDTGFVNNDRLAVAGTLAGLLENHGITTMLGGSVDGDVNNLGTLNGGGSVTGQLVNNGTLTADRRISVGALVNNQTTTVAQGGVLASAEAVQNQSTLGVAGLLQADLLNRATGTTTLSGGTIAGDVANLGRLTGTGTISGTVRNAAEATLGGRVDAVQNLEAGQFAVQDTLATQQFVNAGGATIGAGTALTMVDPDAQAAPVPVQNLATGTLTVDGRLHGALVNAGTLGGAGTITGSVLNTGSANWAGGIGGSVTNQGTLALSGGSITGGLVNQSGSFVTRGNTSVAGGIRNQSAATARIMAGSTLTTANGVLNEAGGNVWLDGRLNGDLQNRGTLSQTGTLAGSLATSGRTTLAGAVTGDLIYDGGTLVLRDSARIGRDFRLNTDYAVAAGTSVAAARTVVAQGSTLTLAGLLEGGLLNQGMVAVQGNQARVAGPMTNDATVDMTDGSTSGVLRVGGLEGTGTYRLDLNLRTMTSDRIEVLGGAAHGAYHLDFDLAERDTVPQRGARVTLIDVDDSYGSANDFSYTRSELPAGSERIVYSVQRADAQNQTGDLELVSQLNPAMGAIFGNVALVQSLIGSVVNRPTSPFVTALAYEDAEKPCGIGSWGRVIGGHATASGRTDNGISNVETEVDADYYGMQVGTDFACFDNRFGGWNMAFGALAGLNRGSTSQPVYAIDPNNSQDLTAILTSYTSTDFEQRYAGLYATATKGRFQADLQYRVERTDFTISNDPLPGYTGLGLDETDFSSDTQTLSGSVSYGFPIGKSGWAVLPTMGFAWSKLSTDSIRFDDDYSLIFKDSTRKIGFAGATVAKTFVDNGRNSALYAFATGTWYKDFADPTISLFASTENTETLTTENLGSYGEISVGANWIKVLGAKARGRQVSAGARIDARFGDQLDSVGVSGQLRWQF